MPWLQICWKEAQGRTRQTVTLMKRSKLRRTKAFLMLKTVT